MKSTIIYDSTRNENDGRFQTGYRASIGAKYVTIEYQTNWQGDRDKVWRVAISDFEAAPGETAEDKILYFAQDEPDWKSQPIE